MKHLSFIFALFTFLSSCATTPVKQTRSEESYKKCPIKIFVANPKPVTVCSEEGECNLTGVLRPGEVFFVGEEIQEVGIYLMTPIPKPARQVISPLEEVQIQMRDERKRGFKVPDQILLGAALLVGKTIQDDKFFLVTIQKD